MQTTLTEKQYLKAVRKRLLKKSKRWGALLYQFNLKFIRDDWDLYQRGVEASSAGRYTPKATACDILWPRSLYSWAVTSIEDLQRFHNKGFLRDTKGVEAFLKSNKRISVPDYV